jgi:hypothetical protein
MSRPAQTRHQQLIEAREKVQRQLELLKSPTRGARNSALIAELTTVLEELEDNLANLDPEDDQVAQVQTPPTPRRPTVDTPIHVLKPSALVLIPLMLLFAGFLLLRHRTPTEIGFGVGGGLLIAVLALVFWRQSRRFT